MRTIDTVTRRERRPVVLAMHHGPQKHPLQLFDGLINRSAIADLLARRPWTHVICGHDHRCLDIGRVHVAPSVAHHPDPVRLYAVAENDFHPIYQSAFPGNYF